MKIALIGYGKMGKAIEEILIERGHEVPLKINRTPSDEELKNVEIAIEFSKPDAAFENIKQLIKNDVITVSGTTGWLENLPEIEALVKQHDGTFLTASNFSLGVNLFFVLNEYLAKIISPYPEYEVSIEEIHHTQKLDKPSGTAITTAEGIINNSTKKGWVLDEKLNNDTIPIFSKRIDKVPGTHTVDYVSEIDTITLTHTAHSRKGFALGAVIAAEWLTDKKGIYSIRDVLGIA